MKYNVAQRFKDKYTREIYLPSNPFESDDTKRIKDLLDRNLIKEIKEIDLKGLTNKELRRKLEQEGIDYDTKANKKELKALLGGD